MNDPLIAQFASNKGQTAPRYESSEDDVINNSDDPLLPSLRARRKSRAFCFCCPPLRHWTWKRWLLTVSLLLILIILLVLALVWWVAVPHYVQGQMDATKIKVLSVVMDNAWESGFDVSLEMTMTMASDSYEIEMEHTNVCVSFNGTAMGEMTLPAMKFDRGTVQFNRTIQSKFRITHPSHFALFSQDMIKQRGFAWDLNGATRLKISGVPVFNNLDLSSIQFRQRIELSAMNGLANIEIESIDLPRGINFPNEINAHQLSDGQQHVFQSATLQGIALNSRISIYNPSPMQIYMGDVTFALRYDPAEQDPDPINGSGSIGIGILVARNLTLKASSRNEIDLVGALVNPDTMPELNTKDGQTLDSNRVREVMGQFFTRFLHHETQKMGVVGYSGRDELLARNASDYPFGYRIEPKPVVPWIETGVRAVQNNVTYQLDARRHVSIDKIDLASINFKIPAGITNEFRPVLAGKVLSKLSVPFLFPLFVDQVHLKMSLKRKNLLIGTLISDWDKTTTESMKRTEPMPVQSYALETALNDARSDDIVLRIPEESREVYQRFLRDVVRDTSVQVAVQGSADARILCGLGGYIEIKDLSFDSMVTIEGMDRMDVPNLFHFTLNLDVSKALLDSALEFGLDGAWMRRPGSGRRLGLEVYKPIVFEMYHVPDTGKPLYANEPEKEITSTVQSNFSSLIRRDDMGIYMGKVKLDELNLSDKRSCNTSLFEPFSNSTWQSPDNAEYCLVRPLGLYEEPNVEKNSEECVDRQQCPGRSFLSTYLDGISLTHRPLNISLHAIDGPRDLKLALPELTFRNVSLPGYHHLAYNLNRPPFQLVRRIIVKAGQRFEGWTPRIYLWLEFYNPFRIPLRYYYINVNTYWGGQRIGTLHVNLTKYDPFEKKRNFQYQPARFRSRTDPYGPHPSKQCVQHQDCQIAPIDLEPSMTDEPWCGLPYQPTIHRTRRLEVKLAPSTNAVVAFLRMLAERKETRLNVTLRGQVAVGVGAKPFKGPARSDPDAPEWVHSSNNEHDPAYRDPFFHPDNPQEENTYVTWLDYGQDKTELWMRKLWHDDRLPDDPPPQCETAQ